MVLPELFVQYIDPSEKYEVNKPTKRDPQRIVKFHYKKVFTPTHKEDEVLKKLGIEVEAITLVWYYDPRLVGPYIEYSNNYIRFVRQVGKKTLTGNVNCIHPRIFELKYDENNEILYEEEEVLYKDQEGNMVFGRTSEETEERSSLSPEDCYISLRSYVEYLIENGIFHTLQESFQYSDLFVEPTARSQIIGALGDVAPGVTKEIVHEMLLYYKDDPKMIAGMLGLLGSCFSNITFSDIIFLEEIVGLDKLPNYLALKIVKFEPLPEGIFDKYVEMWKTHSYYLVRRAIFQKLSIEEIETWCLSPKHRDPIILRTIAKLPIITPVMVKKILEIRDFYAIKYLAQREDLEKEAYLSLLKIRHSKIQNTLAQNKVLTQPMVVELFNREIRWDCEMYGDPFVFFGSIFSDSILLSLYKYHGEKLTTIMVHYPLNTQPVRRKRKTTIQDFISK